MTSYKKYVENLFKGHKVHFTSDCIIKIDIIGTVVGVDRMGSEIIYMVDTGERVVKVGENTAKLMFEFLS